MEEEKTEEVSTSNKKELNKGLIIIAISVLLIIMGLVILILLPSSGNNNQEKNTEKEEKLKPLPLPEVTGGERGQLGIDKNINESTIDEYLNRPDSVYRDMRMLIDPASYESIGGDSSLSGYVNGFQIVPLPYLIPVTGLPDAVGQTYSGQTLFRIDENGQYVPNYKESMSIIEELFPRNKVIFLMCGGGGYAGMTKAFLVSLGWDENKIYNTGGYWYYDGKNNIEVPKDENGYNFSMVPYHEINFSYLTEYETLPDTTTDPKDTKAYLDDKYYNKEGEGSKAGEGVEILSLIKYKDQLAALGGTPEGESIEKEAKRVAMEYGQKINQMIENKESFILEVSPGDYCNADVGVSLASNIYEVANENNFYFYSIGLLVYKNTVLYKTIKYAPTVIIIIKGEVVAYIDAESDDDLKYSQSKEELKNWLESYIHLTK